MIVVSYGSGAYFRNESRDGDNYALVGNAALQFAGNMCQAADLLEELFKFMV
jgi:hypothetical protein